MKKTIFLFLFMGLILTLNACNKDDELTVSKITAINANKIEVTFSDGETIEVNDFSPRPLKNGDETEVSFTYNDEAFTGTVKYEIELLEVVAISEEELKATFDNGVSLKLKNFTPSPLVLDQETEVKFTYQGKEYVTKVTWQQPEIVNVLAINPNLIEVEFNDGKVKRISDFTPQPLEKGVSTTVAFSIDDFNYTVETKLEVIEMAVEVTGQKVQTANPGHILGGNLGVWTAPSKLTEEARDYVIATGAKVMRFPGGNLANNYSWRYNYVFEHDQHTYNDWSTWAMDVDDYLAFIKEVDAVPLYNLNPFNYYIDGVTYDYVEEAELLVEKFIDEGFKGAYYEVGNENNGDWNPMLSVEEYTEKFIILAEAVKAIDPEAKLMGPVVGENDQEWFEGFVNLLVREDKLHLLDYLTYHQYGGWMPAIKGVDLDFPLRVEREVSLIRELLDDNGGEDIKIAITEYNSGLWDENDHPKYDSFTIKQALWAAHYIGELFIQPVDMGNIWITMQPATDPHALIDDQKVELTSNYWPSYLASLAFSNDDEIEMLDVQNSETNQESVIYAADKGEGQYGILFVNKEESYKQIELSVEDVTEGTIKAWSFSSYEYDHKEEPVELELSWTEDGKIDIDFNGYSILVITIE